MYHFAAAVGLLAGHGCERYDWESGLGLIFVISLSGTDCTRRGVMPMTLLAFS